MSFFSYLLQNGIISSDVYNVISKKQVYDEKYTVLCEYVYEEELCVLLSKYTNLPCATEYPFHRINIDYKRFTDMPSIPWCIQDGSVYIATYNPDDIKAKDQISYYMQTIGFNKQEYCVASRNQIQQSKKNLNRVSTSDIDYTLMLNDAIKINASDIHITPYAKAFNIMFRINGDLCDYMTLPLEKYNTLVITLKVKAKLDIAENRRPQSGQFCFGTVDFRLSTHPTAFGENIVIRILNKNKQIINIENLGFSKDEAAYLKHIIKQKQGLIIFCGPTGSGKSTSIYALIELMDKKTRNIMTLEDPIEYSMQNVRQTEIIPGVIDFVTGIRSILRQDPDVILIGEIRDEETAQMAIRAAMTGHLVLTTIHANDCLGAIFRLQHFNVPPSFTAENLTSVISQRLIKNKDNTGRTVIAEILKPDANFRNLVSNGASRSELLQYAISNLGYVPLKL